VIRGRPAERTGMLRHVVMVPYHGDPGFTTEIIGVHTVYAGSTLQLNVHAFASLKIPVLSGRL